MANEVQTLKEILKEREDLKIGDSTLMVTGNLFLLEARHGVLFETEEHYGDITLPDGKVVNTYSSSYEDDLIFENYVMLPITTINRYGSVKKRRPEGFVSKSSTSKELQIKTDIDSFMEMYSEELKEPKIRIYNTDGGVTIGKKDDGALFDLAKAPIVTKNTEEVVKRLKIPHKILMELLEDRDKGKAFFNQIKEEMKSLGCPHYTFERPDGEIKLYRKEFHSNIELRAYGMRLEE